MFAGAVHRAFAAAAEARGGARRAFCWLSLSYFGLTLVGRTPGRCRNSRRVSGVLRAYRGQASGPRDPLGRKNSATSTAPFWFRAARSGVGRRPSAQARRFEEPHEHRIHSPPHSQKFVLGVLFALSSSGRSLRELG